MASNDDANLAERRVNQPVDEVTSSGEPIGSVDGVHLGIPLARPIGLARPIDTTVRRAPAMWLESISVGAAWLDLAVMVLALIAFEFSSATLIEMRWGSLHQLSDEKFAQMQQAVLPYVIGGRAVLVVLVIVLANRLRRLSSASVGYTVHAFGKNIFVGMAMLGVAWSLIAVCQVLLVTLVPSYLGDATENIERLSGLLPRISLLGYLMLSLFVGVYEELLFRGFLLPRLRRATGNWALAIVLSTVVFVSMHLSTQTVASIVPLTILSVAFCLTTIWRQSLVPAIVGHAVFDFVNFLIISRAIQ